MRVPKTLSTVESRGATGAGVVLARHTVSTISSTRMGPSRIANPRARNARLLAIMGPSILSLPPGQSLQSNPKGPGRSIGRLPLLTLRLRRGRPTFLHAQLDPHARLDVRESKVGK